MSTGGIRGPDIRIVTKETCGPDDNKKARYRTVGVGWQNDKSISFELYMFPGLRLLAVPKDGEEDK